MINEIAITSVIPIVQEAFTKVESLTRQEFDFVRALANPHELLKDTIRTVSVLLGQGSTWEQARKIITFPDLKNSLLLYDFALISKQLMTQAKPLLDNPELNVARLTKISTVGAVLIQWARAIERYYLAMNAFGEYDKKKNENNEESSSAKKDNEESQDAEFKTASFKISAEMSFGNNQELNDLVRPIVMAALQQVHNSAQFLTKATLSELSSFKQPTVPIRRVLSLLALLFSRSDEWLDGQKLLRDPRLYDKIINFDIRTPNLDILTFMKSHLSEEYMTVPNISNHSKAAAELFQWVHSIFQCWQVLLSVQSEDKEGSSKDEKEQEEELIKIEDEYKLSSEETELANAQTDLRALNKVYLLELSAYKKPPIEVRKTISLVGFLLGYDADDWENARELLKDVQFLAKLLSLKIDELHEDALSRLEIQLNDPFLFVDSVDKVSIACAKILRWVKSVVSYLRWKRIEQQYDDAANNLAEDEEEEEFNQRGTLDKTPEIRVIKEEPNESSPTTTDNQNIGILDRRENNIIEQDRKIEKAVRFEEDQEAAMERMGEDDEGEGENEGGQIDNEEREDGEPNTPNPNLVPVEDEPEESQEYHRQQQAEEDYEREIDEAVDDVRMLDREQIRDLRSIALPSTKIQKTLGFLALLFDKDQSWEAARILLLDPNFLATLIGFNPKKISNRVLSKIASEIDDPRFTVENVTRQSYACGIYFRWIKAVYEYGRWYNSINPQIHKSKFTLSEIKESQESEKDEEAKQSINEDEGSANQEEQIDSGEIKDAVKNQLEGGTYHQQEQSQPNYQTTGILKTPANTFADVEGKGKDSVQEIDNYEQQEYEQLREENDQNQVEEEGSERLNTEQRQEKEREQLIENIDMESELRNMMNNISARDLNELKSLHHPPILVQLALKAVFLLLDNKEYSWIDTKKKLKTLQQRILNYNIKNTTPRSIAKVIDIIPQCLPSKISTVSKSASSLISWVTVVVRLWDLYCQTEVLNQENPTEQTPTKVKSATVGANVSSRSQQRSNSPGKRKRSPKKLSPNKRATQTDTPLENINDLPKTLQDKVKSINTIDFNEETAVQLKLSDVTQRVCQTLAIILCEKLTIANQLAKDPIQFAERIESYDVRSLPRKKIARLERLVKSIHLDSAEISENLPRGIMKIVEWFQSIVEATEYLDYNVGTPFPPEVVAAIEAAEISQDTCIPEIHNCNVPSLKLAKAANLALCLFGKGQHWQSARQVLPYVRNFYEFDIESVHEETIKRAKYMIDDPELSLSVIRNASKVGFELVLWAGNNIKLWYVLRAYRERDLPRKEPPTIVEKPPLTFAEQVAARKQAVTDTVRKLTRNAIKEITSQDTPSQQIVHVLNILMILLGEEDTWIRARTVIANKTFIDRLREVDITDIPEQNIRKAEELLESTNFIRPEDMLRHSVAAKYLSSWVHEAVRNWKMISIMEIGKDPCRDTLYSNVDKADKSKSGGLFPDNSGIISFRPSTTLKARSNKDLRYTYRPNANIAQGIAKEISRVDLISLNSMSIPPGCVLDSLLSICALIGEDRSWSTAKSLMRVEDLFLNKLVNIDVGAINEPAIRYAERLMKKESNEPNLVRSKSYIGYQFINWVNAIIESWRINKFIEQGSDPLAKISKYNPGETYQEPVDPWAGETEEQRIKREKSEALLDTVLPNLLKSEQSLGKMTIQDLAEIRSFVNPPARVGKVFRILATLLGENYDWQSIRNMLAEKNFVSKLMNIDREAIPKDRIDRAAEFLEDEDTEPEVVAKVSVQSYGFAVWCRAIVQYSRVMDKVRVIMNKK